MAKSGKVTDLRITSGTLRGQKILTPKLAVTHPMGSRERLAIMNSLSSHLEGKVVLDVFSGTGALGFEALSRGAKHVSFIENQSLDVILEQLEEAYERLLPYYQATRE